MRHAQTLRTSIAAACLLVIAGCAVTQGDVNSAYDSANSTANAAMNNLPGSMALVEDVPTAFLGDRLVPVAYEATLPATFREKRITMPANLDINQIANLVSGATGVGELAVPQPEEGWAWSEVEFRSAKIEGNGGRVLVCTGGK